MRKLLFIMLLIFSCCANAQEVQRFESPLKNTNNGHLTFRDIPIDGSINDFVSNLNKIGYVKTKDLKNCVVLSGEFAGRDCEIFILYTEKTNIVWKVAVFLPEKSSWYTIESDYKYFKDQYIAKYGRPNDSYEFFSDPYYKGDGYEMQAVKVDKCNYYSYWNTDSGTIVVAIGSSCQVILSYEDKINSEINTKEKRESVLNDI